VEEREHRNWGVKVGDRGEKTSPKQKGEEKGSAASGGVSPQEGNLSSSSASRPEKGGVVGRKKRVRRAKKEPLILMDLRMPEGRNHPFWRIFLTGGSYSLIKAKRG